MDKKQKNQSGLPLRSCFFGGFKKSDVTDYIEKIVSDVEEERAKNENDRKQLYDLMKNGQQFCDDLTLQTQKNANAIVEVAEQNAQTLILDAQQTGDVLVNEAQQHADEILNSASEAFQLLKEEQAHFIEQAQTNAQQLAKFIAKQQQQTAQTYEQMLQPIMEMLQRLEGE